MNADDRERQAEQWLDAALSHYSDVQPRPGLEQRILASLEARRRPLRWSRWVWIPAAAVLTLSVALVWNVRRSAQPVVIVSKAPPQKTEAAGLNPRIIRTVPPAVHLRRLAPRRMQASVSRPEPTKQEVFPSPEPLSEQERLALNLVRNAPEEALGLAQAQEVERERTRALEKQSNPSQQ